MKNNSHKGLGAIRAYSRRQTLVAKKLANWIPLELNTVEDEWKKRGLP